MRKIITAVAGGCATALLAVGTAGCAADGGHGGPTASGTGDGIGGDPAGASRQTGAAARHRTLTPRPLPVTGSSAGALGAGTDNVSGTVTPPEGAATADRDGTAIAENAAGGATGGTTATGDDKQRPTPGAHGSPAAPADPGAGGEGPVSGPDTGALALGPLDGLTALAAAESAAQLDHKPVLVAFGTTWSANCAAMAKAMGTPAVRSALAAYHFVPVNVGAGIAANMDMLTRYSGDQASGTTYGMPVLMVLDPAGTVRADTSKSGNPAFDEAHFAAFLKKWAS